MWQATKQNGKIAFGRPPTAREEWQKVRTEQAGKANLTLAEMQKRVLAQDKLIEELLNTK
jgi:hypothetical protein